MPTSKNENYTTTGIKPGSNQGQTMVVTPPAPLKAGKKGKKIDLEKPSKNLKDIVDVSPKMKQGVNEAKETHHVFTFGRMNPPTTGHEKLINKTHEIAKSKGAQAHVVASHSHDGKKNPLPQDKKMHYLSKINKSAKVVGSSKESPSFLHHAKKAHADGHSHLHMVAGSDRTKEYETTLKKYNGHPDHYNFKSITVHSAGHRDPDSHGTEGISGTKMRDHAKAGDHKSFKAGLPKSLHKHARQISGHIKEATEEFIDNDWDMLEEEINCLTDEQLLNIVNVDVEKEDMINERVMTLMQRRKAALKMRRLKFRIMRARKIKKKRMATLDMLTRRARRQARQFIRKRIAGKQGANYVDLSPSQKIAIDKRMQSKMPFINKLARRLLPKVKQAELVRLRAARKSKSESYTNLSFESFITEIRNDWETDSDTNEQFQEIGNQSTAQRDEAADPRVGQLKDKHTREVESQGKQHKIEKEKLTAQIARQKQAEIRREAKEVSEVVDVMVDALAALDKKAHTAGIELDTLFVEFIEGYNEPHGKQTPQQGGFAAVNRLIAEMSSAEKDKAEDIVKGMKKKASYFTKKYGKDAKTVMYATANKMAQEDMKQFRNEITEGGWEGWSRFNKKTGKDLEQDLSKARKAGKNKSRQFKKFGNVDDDSIGEQVNKAFEGMGAAYMPDAEMKKTAEREITSKAVMKQLNRNKNRDTMKGRVRTPNVRYVHDRQRDTDLTRSHRGKTVINPETKRKTKGNRKKKK